MTVLVGVMVGVLLSLSVAQVNTQRVLCGRTLADTLDLVCAGRGFFFNKRSVDSMPKETVAAKEVESRVKRSAGGGGPMRSVVDECCRRACTYSVLESYCAPVDDTFQITQEEIDSITNQRDTTIASTLYTTTQSTAHYDPNSPSAEVFRGPSRVAFPQNRRKFFYVQVGVRPTRNPLISE